MNFFAALAFGTNIFFRHHCVALPGFRGPNPSIASATRLWRAPPVPAALFYAAKSFALATLSATWKAQA